MDGETAATARMEDHMAVTKAHMAITTTIQVATTTTTTVAVTIRVDMIQVRCLNFVHCLRLSLIALRFLPAGYSNYGGAGGYGGNYGKYNNYQSRNNQNQH